MVLKIGRQGSEIVKSGSLKLPGGGLRSLTLKFSTLTLAPTLEPEVSPVIRLVSPLLSPVFVTLPSYRVFGRH